MLCYTNFSGVPTVSRALVPAASPVDQEDLARVFAVWRGRLAPATALAYDAGLLHFAGWLTSTGRATVTGPREAVAWLIGRRKLEAESAAVAYLQELAARGLASRSIRHRRAALRSAVKTCEVLGACPWRLEASMPRGIERQTKRQTAGPTLDQLRQLLAAAATQRQPKAARDVALLRLIVALRVRESEVCRLRVRDYHAGTVVLVLKGHREGVSVEVPAGVQEALDDYLALRGVVTPADPLFASLDRAKRGDGCLTRAGLHQLVQSLARRAGLPGAISPHRLLHTGSTTLANAGVSTDELQAWGRWEKRETAETYIDSRQRVAERLATQLDDFVTGKKR